MPQANAVLQQALSDRYRITGEVGQGGMATVYRADDLKHERKVALKVLRPELAAIVGGERFLNEIRLTANLQHPHILPLHDSGEVSGFIYYVMPLVEGESLRDRLNREKQLPIEDATRIAGEVASALDYAHRHGVVHRDIKPENVLLHDGRAVVTDFGIALAVSTVGGTRMTETGMSLGTPHYMSPEQAMGEREITAKSDIYALGCVVYEMLVGEPPFTGPTAQAIVARVVTEEPRSLTLQRKTVPPHVEAGVFKALAKLPADRFASAAQFAEALIRGAGAPVAPARAATSPVAQPGRHWITAGVIGAVALAAGLAGGRLLAPRGVPAPPARFSITVAPDQRISGAPQGTLALSPDGTMLIYVGGEGTGTRLFLRRLDDLAATPLPGTERAIGPRFSRDGRWVSFISGTQLKRVGLTGGAPAVATLDVTGIFWAAWLAEGDLIIETLNGAVGRVTPSGALDTILTDADAVDILPDGTILVTPYSRATRGPLVALDPRSGTQTTIVPGIVVGAAYDGEHLLWVQPDGVMLGAPFDVDRLALTGSPVTLATDVRVTAGGPAHIAASRSGSVAYVPAVPVQLMGVSRSGAATPLTEEARRFHSPRVSTDGRRVAVDFTLASSRDVWVLDLRPGTLSRVSFDDDGHDPVWMPDGRIAYVAGGAGALIPWARRADGSGERQQLFTGEGGPTAATFTPDGRHMIVHATGVAGSYDILVVRLDSGTVRVLLATPFNESFAALSPDGRWLAYASDESGKVEVYVRPFPQGEGRVLVSRNGGTEPVWSRDGRELFFRAGAEGGTVLVAARVETRPEFRVVEQVPLFDVADYEGSAPHANYDVLPDGRFVMVAQGGLAEIVFIQNWPELVRGQSAPR